MRLLNSAYGRLPGFTLLEIMLVMGLSILVYSLISYTTIQLSNASRNADAAMKRKKNFVDVCEQMRWQLRCLYARVPEGVTGKAPASNVNPAGLKGAFLYGKRDASEGQGILIFKTSYFPKGSTNCGTAEVGYKIISSLGKSKAAAPVTLGVSASTGQQEIHTVTASDTLTQSIDPKKVESYLAYRQYPWADPLGLHESGDDPRCPWKPICTDITGMSLAFSDDESVWQQEWTSKEVPKWIRVTLSMKGGEPLSFIAAPAVAAARWQ